MDRYIDNQETQTYGPRFSAALRRMFPDAGPIQTFIHWAADQLDASTDTMRDAMARQRSAGSARTATATDKLPTEQAARATLKAFQLHLQARKIDSEDPWSGDVELFVPGGMSSIGSGARALCNAIRIARTCLDVDKSVPDRTRWLKRLDAHAAALAPFVSQTDAHEHAHQTALSEQSSEKRNWLRTYRAVSKILEGCLLLVGREDELSAAVPHLGVAGARKKTPSTPVPPNDPARPS